MHMICFIAHRGYSGRYQMNTEEAFLKAVAHGSGGIETDVRVTADGVLVVNDCRIDPMTVVIGAKEYPQNILDELKKEHALYAIDGQKIALELGNSKVLNSVVLGYAAGFIGFDKQAWLDTVANTVPPKTVELNQIAFTRGYDANH